jgi:ADP-ribose pyrophosphatase YjhB (NUDIX family)
MQNDFTIRVYALVVNQEEEVLVMRETYRGIEFSKFPGGGLEWGEGILETIKRELNEELKLTDLEFTHFYTTDFFVESYFDTSTQVISVYYKVARPIAKNSVNIQVADTRLLSYRWIALDDLRDDAVTFPIDKHVVRLLQKGK